MEIRRIRQFGKKETEEPLLCKLYRELSYPIVKICLDYNVSPDSISYLNILVAFLSPIFFLYGQFAVGIVFLFIWRVLDCVDGEIARITKDFSPSGGFLDYIGEKILPPLLFVFIGINTHIFLSSLVLAVLYVLTYYPIMIGIRPRKNIFTRWAEGLYLPVYIVIFFILFLFTGSNLSFFILFVYLGFLYGAIFNRNIFSVNRIKEGIRMCLNKIKRKRYS